MSEFEGAVGTQIGNEQIRSVRQELYAEPISYDGSAEVIAAAEAIDALAGLTPVCKMMCRDEHLPFLGQGDFWDTDGSMADRPLLTRLTVEYVAPRNPDIVTDKYAVAVGYGSFEQGIVLTNRYLLRRFQRGRATLHMRLACGGIGELLQEQQISLPVGLLNRATMYETHFLGRELRRLQALPAEQDAA